MEVLNKYFTLQDEIYDYFGYKEDWKVIPIEDRRGYAWYLTGDSVYYIEAEKNVNDKWDEYYRDDIYMQRHLPKWVYRGKEYTMVCVDTHIDGNKFLAIYENQKEITENPI